MTTTTVTVGANDADTYGDSGPYIKIKENNPGAFGTSDLEVFQWNTGDVGEALVCFKNLGTIGGVLGTVYVTDASLTFTLVDGSGETNPDYQVGAYQVLRDWTDVSMTPCWSFYSGVLPWTVPGAMGVGDIVLTPVAQNTCPTADFGTTFVLSGAALVALVQGWLDGSISNYGVMLMRNDIPYPPPGPVEQSRVFGSLAAGEGNRPYLTITYSDTPVFDVSWAGPSTHMI